MTAGEPADRLLRALAAHGGLDFAAACRAIGESPDGLRRLVRELDGLVEPAHPTAYQPPYRLTEAGRARLAERTRRRPAETLRLVLRSRPGAESETLAAALYRGGHKLAGGATTTDSYRLAAIRYLFAFAPGGVTASVAMRAAAEIGAALLPPCRRCAGSPATACDSCVRGVYRARVGAARAAGDWVELHLSALPPWHQVPWEMARLDGADDFLARDPAVQLVRRVAAPAPRPRLFEGPIGVLIAAAVPPSPDDGRAVTAEGDELAALLRDCAAPDRPVTVHRLPGYRTADELRAEVRRVRPRVVHLLGHGSLDGPVAGTRPLGKRAVAAAVAGAEVVLLGCCYGATEAGTDAAGASLGRLVAGHGVRSVVAFEGGAEARHAQRFAVEFYRELCRSGSADLAVRAARDAMALTGSPLYQWGQVVHFAG